MLGGCAWALAFGAAALRAAPTSEASAWRSDTPVAHPARRRAHKRRARPSCKLPPAGRRGSASLFCPTSFLNAPLPRDARLDPASEQLSNSLADEAEREYVVGTGPWLETSNYTTPLYRVPRDQPTVPVALKDGGLSWRRSLQRAFRRVPIPPAASAAAGTDAVLTIWQPSTDRLWEFWQARRDQGGRWHAAWGGAMERVSKSPGYYTRDSWRGSGSYWGTSATSIPVIAGVMLLRELERGRVDHALAIGIPNPRATVFSWPAQRTDGTSHDPNSIPMGARFRLDPNLDLDQLGLPRLVRIIAGAAQRYGIVVHERTGRAIGFSAEDWKPSGLNPWPGYLEGKQIADLIAQFPWRHLQLLKMRPCNTGPTGRCSWRR